MQKERLLKIIEPLNKFERAWLHGYLEADNKNLVPLETQNLQALNHKAHKVTVFYATETGTAKKVSAAVSKKLQALGLKAKVQDLDAYNPAKITKEGLAVYIVSTHGEGEMPESAKEFFSYLQEEQPDLGKQNFSVIALGDSSYTQFCQAGKDLEKQLEKLNASPLRLRIDFDLDFKESLDLWLNEAEAIFEEYKAPDAVIQNVANDLEEFAERKIVSGEIVANVNLNDDGSVVETRHVEILPDEEVSYKPGSALGVILDDEKEPARLYSISSAPSYHDDEIHLTVRRVEYEGEDGEVKLGLCSNYLANLEPGSKVNFYIQNNDDFGLPRPEQDLIMVGPGTGVAPFRSILFERKERGDSGRNWLFFGAQNFKTDFLYQTELQELKEEGHLQHIDLAFSRDQQEKIYVQDLLLERAVEVFEWLESGAVFMVCGDKNNMAKDVENALLKILAEQGGLSAEAAKDRLRKLKEEQRYLRDVY